MPELRTTQAPRREVVGIYFSCAWIPRARKIVAGVVDRYTRVLKDKGMEVRRG